MPTAEGKTGQVDLASQTAGAGWSGLQARHVMREKVDGVHRLMTVQQAAAFLIDQEVSGAPVVDDAGKLIGVVSVTDIVQATSEQREPVSMDRPQAYYESMVEEGLSPQEIQDLSVEVSDRTVEEIMTPAVYSVSADVSVGEVARTMLSSRIHRLFVSSQDEIVGMVSSMDLLKLLAQDRPGKG